MKIVLDPGHSGPVEPGCCHKESGMQEWRIAGDIADKLKFMLEADGHEVLFTRSGPIETDDLAFRAALASDNQADIFVSIHINAATIPTAHGTEVYCFPGSLKGRRLAEAILPEVCTEMGTESRGVKESSFYVLRETSCPAALVEVAFLSNDEDRAKMAQTGGRIAAANGIFYGIRKYAG